MLVKEKRRGSQCAQGGCCSSVFWGEKWPKLANVTTPPTVVDYKITFLEFKAGFLSPYLNCAALWSLMLKLLWILSPFFNRGPKDTAQEQESKCVIDCRKNPRRDFGLHMSLSLILLIVGQG